MIFGLKVKQKFSEEIFPLSLFGKVYIIVKNNSLNIDKDGPRQKEERFGQDLSWHYMTDSLNDIDLIIGVASTGFFRCCNLNSALLWLKVC